MTETKIIPEQWNEYQYETPKELRLYVLKKNKWRDLQEGLSTAQVVTSASDQLAADWRFP